MSNLVEELQWRGLLQDMIPGTEAFLQKEKPVRGYIGYDPTAASLTIGNLVTVKMLVHLQRHGHQPVIVMGGATGMIGDPSGKSAERQFLDEATLRYNVERQKQKFRQLFDFEAENAPIVVNNYDWYAGMSVLQFLREAGKHLTVNYMMSKDSVKSRLETGISFTEFSYQLIQGYDFYHLYTHHGVKLQMGGSDQWGNITAGNEMIRRKAGGEVYAIVCPLLTKADGTKFGKSEGNSIWIDEEFTSPYDFYQFWVNASDADAPRFIRVFSFLPKEEIEALEEEHAKDPGRRVLQYKLAEEVTRWVHGERGLRIAQNATDLLFRKSMSMEEIAELPLETLLSALKGVATYSLQKDKLAAGINVVELLATESDVFPSKGEARKMINGGGVSINKQKLDSPDREISSGDLIHGKLLIAQKGKKYSLFIFE